MLQLLLLADEEQVWDVQHHFEVRYIYFEQLQCILIQYFHLIVGWTMVLLHLFPILHLMFRTLPAFV